jgi:hypothetical protein
MIGQPYQIVQERIDYLMEIFPDKEFVELLMGMVPYFVAIVMEKDEKACETASTEIKDISYKIIRLIRTRQRDKLSKRIKIHTDKIFKTIEESV